MHIESVEKAKSLVVAQYREQYVEDLEDQLYTLNGIVNDQLLNLEMKDGQLKSIRTRHDALVVSLSKRPTRAQAAESQASTPGNTGACTGAELSREDGEFLAGEASRAQAVVEERDYYYRTYRDVKARIDKLAGKANE